MAKKDNKNFHPAEDYLAQLHWQSKHQRQSSGRYAPRWRYNILYKNNIYISYIPATIFFLGIIALVILQVYLAIVKHSAKAIFGLIFTLLGIAILFYAIRDAGKNEDEDDDEEVNEVTDPDIQ